MLIGKDKLINYFKNIENISHFYIFSGEAGIGKRTLAEYVAAYLHCEVENKPCGTCPACRQHKAGTHPDFVYITEKDKTKKSIGVDTIREAVLDMQIKPISSDKKIYIVPDADTLSLGAQNAFLKALEEAPPYIVIIMLAENEKNLLSTVLSRASLIKVPHCTKNQIIDYLKKEYPDSDAETISAYADGNIGRAKKLAEGADEVRDGFFEALLLKPHTEQSWIFLVAEYFEKNKENINKLLMYFNLFLRDAVMIKTGCSQKVINKDKKEQINAFSQKVSIKALISASDRVVECGTRLGKGSNISLWITNLLIACRNDFVSK